MTRPASAFHTEKQRLTDGTAYTMGQYRYRVGLWTMDYGLFKPFDVTTWILPWALQVASLGGKYELRLSDKLSVGTGLTAFRLDVRKLNPNSPKLILSAVPWEVSGSYRVDKDWTVSLQSVYTYIRAEGTLDKDETFGAAALSNLQFVGTVEKRVSEVMALLLRVRWVAYQWPLSASAKVVSHPDDYTTLTIVGTGRAEVFDVRNAWSIVPGVAWSWKHFNLRAGLGYGNFNIGGINVVLQKKTIVPELDLFWLWDLGPNQ
ncbi:MAG: hypothetical protein HY898_24580 [Deltaproteobacteria bacterium]|nr:hypothetical protein [Deltaproteobacteria bacterium]